MSNVKPHSSENLSSKHKPSHPQENLPNTQNESRPQEVKMNPHSHDSSSSHDASHSPGSSSAPEKVAEKSTMGVSPWNHLADLQRQQLALAAECASAMFRGVESMRKIQQEAAHQASAHHAAATQQLRSPEQTADLMALLSTPLRVDMEGVQKYWNQLAATTFQAQAEVMNSICQMFNNESSSSVSSIQEVIQATIPPLASSFFVDSAHERPHHS